MEPLYKVEDHVEYDMEIKQKTMHKFWDDNHTIYHGDALAILRNEIEDNSIDLIFVDPPYNIGKDFDGRKENMTDESYLSWCYEWLNLCISKLKPSGSLYVMTATQYMPYFDLFLRDKLTILSRIVWSYDSSGVQAKRYFGSLYEPILYCVKDKKNYTFNAGDIRVQAKTGAERRLIDYRKNPPQPYNTEKIPGNVWDIPRVRYRMEEYEEHPSQKPIALLERIIKASSNDGDIILDPFSGVFSTSYVCKKLNRKSIGIELSEKYVMTGLRRLEISDHYNGQPLVRPVKSFQQKSTNPTLFPLTK